MACPDNPHLEIKPSAIKFIDSLSVRIVLVSSGSSKRPVRFGTNERLEFEWDLIDCTNVQRLLLDPGNSLHFLGAI